jgi:hypothetical protein
MITPLMGTVLSLFGGRTMKVSPNNYTEKWPALSMIGLSAALLESPATMSVRSRQTAGRVDR